MASASTTTNSELPRQSSICSLSTFIADLQSHHDHHNAVDGGDDDDDEGGEEQASGSLATMDELLNNIYSESPQQQEQQAQVEQNRNPEEPPFAAAAAVGVDEVWKRIVAGESDRRVGAEGGGDGGAMTLEDFLTKSGAVREEDVRVPVGGGGFGHFQSGPMVIYGGNGSGATLATAGRGKRRAVEEPMDKATQQKQRRMIKNRESAARSRERKQAYTVELESLVTQLEEDNARLLREEAERKKERYKQLMENLVPVVERKEKKIMEKFTPEAKKRGEKIRENIVAEAEQNRMLPVLRRVYSMEW